MASTPFFDNLLAFYQLEMLNTAVYFQWTSANATGFQQRAGFCTRFGPSHVRNEILGGQLGAAPCPGSHAAQGCARFSGIITHYYSSRSPIPGGVENAWRASAAFIAGERRPLISWDLNSEMLSSAMSRLTEPHLTPPLFIINRNVEGSLSQIDLPDKTH